MEPLKDGGHLYEVERRRCYAQRSGFHINELQISPTQKVPWHYHTYVQDTFYVIEGRIRIFLRVRKRRLR
jgi:quercetin dioxygenase-like cupin family protein